MINLIQDTVADYTNYPIAIMNGSLSREKKTEIIKKTYRKQDLNKYKKIITSNQDMDMNNIDIFIESTILQNTRIREDRKTKCVLELFADFFVNGFTAIDVYCSRHFNEFKNKYSSYINNKQGLEYFHDICIHNSERREYRKKNQYSAFVNAMLSDIGFNNAVELFSETEDAKCLDNRYHFKNYMVSCADDNYSDPNYIKIVNSYIKYSNNNFADLLDYIKYESDPVHNPYTYSYKVYFSLLAHPTSGIFNFFESLRIIDRRKCNDHSDEYPVTPDKTIIATNLSNIDPKLFNVIHIFDDDCKYNLGFNYRIYHDAYKSESRAHLNSAYAKSVFIKSIYSFDIEFFKCLQSLLKTQNINRAKQYAASMVNNYFSIFEDESGSSEMLKDFTSLYQASLKDEALRVCKYHNYYNTTSKDITLIDGLSEVISLFDNVATDAYKISQVDNWEEKASNVHNNLWNVYNSLQLLNNM